MFLFDKLAGRGYIEAYRQDGLASGHSVDVSVAWGADTSPCCWSNLYRRLGRMIIQLCDREIELLNDLMPVSVKLYIKLKELRSGYGTEEFYRSARDLGRDCSMDPKTITKSIKQLQKSGLIDRTKSRKLKTNRFFLNYF